jgi:hypothetical protein
VSSDVHDKTSWSTLNETDDYSYTGSTDYTVTDKVTVYQGTTLVYGAEPS